LEAQIYLTKAENSLKAAQLCFEAGLYDDAVSRAYYCVLRAAIALLVKFGHFPETKRTHNWVRALLPREFVKRKKLLPKELIANFTELQNERDIADYEPKLISKKSADRIMSKSEKIDHAAREIISRVQKKFPKVKVKGVIDWINADAAIEFITPEDNGFEISEFTAPLQIKFFEKEGIDIRVLPLEEIDGHHNN